MVYWQSVAKTPLKEGFLNIVNNMTHKEMRKGAGSSTNLFEINYRQSVVRIFAKVSECFTAT